MIENRTRTEREPIEKRTRNERETIEKRTRTDRETNENERRNEREPNENRTRTNGERYDIDTEIIYRRDYRANRMQSNLFELLRCSR